MTIEEEAREIVESSVVDDDNDSRFIDQKKIIRLIAKALQKKQDRIEELEFILNSDVPFGTMLMNAEKKVNMLESKLFEYHNSYEAQNHRIYELKSALKRLASLEAFTSPRMIDKALDCELVARIDFAKKAIGCVS